MNLAPLTPLVVSVAAPLVLALTHRSRHLVEGGCSIYMWSRGLAYFILVGYLILVFVLGFLPQSRAIDDPAGRAVMLAFATIGALGFAYTYRYRIIVNDAEVRAGAFSLRTVKFADVTEARFIQGQRSGQIILRSKSGLTINIWETINDFGSCARAINARLPEGLSLPGEGRMTSYLHEKGGPPRGKH